MNDSSAFVEYSVTKERSALYNVAKVVTPIISGVVPTLYSIYMLFAYGFPPYAFFTLELSTILVVLSLSYFKRVDYDYRMVGSELYFSTVYNRKRRKEMGSIDVSRLDKFAPYAGKYYDEAAADSYTRVYDFSSAPDAPDVFYGVETNDESGDKTLYIFNASEKMLRIIKQYNRKAIITLSNE